MIHPAGIIRNTGTGRYHPVVFHRSPLPSEGAWDENEVQRHKSSGHHTKGFDTIEEAEAEIVANGWEDKGGRWMWDGEGVPAIHSWF